MAFKEVFGQGYTVDCLFSAPQGWLGGTDKRLDIGKYRLWSYLSHGRWKWSVTVLGTDFTLIEGDAESSAAAQTAATQMYQVITQGLHVLSQYEAESV